MNKRLQYKAKRKNRTTASYPKVYLYRRMVQAKLFINHHYAEKIDLDNISDEAYFSKFHFIRLFKTMYSKPPTKKIYATEALFKDDSGNYFSLQPKNLIISYENHF